jgi:sugar-specific transcriptional regulator TrmB
MDSEIEVRNELQQYGLSDQEALLYVALVKKSSTASDVAEKTGIQRTRIYEIARELEAKGFIEMSLERPVIFRAVNPESVLKKLKSDYEKKIHELNSKGQEIVDILKKMPSEEEDNGRIWSINGESNIISKFNEMCKNAEGGVCFTTQRFSAIDKIEKTLVECNSRNVEIKAAVPILECTKPYARRLAKFSNLRHFDHRIRLLLVDGSEVLIFLVDPDKGVEDFTTGNLPACEKALYSRNNSLVYIFSQFFDDIWEASVSTEKLLE